MSLAADTREAARARPFLLAALRAGVVNYTAAAGWLRDEAGLDGDRDAVATALRRFAEDLDAYAASDRRASVAMRSGVAVVDGDGGESGEQLVRVGDAVVVGGGRLTAIIATGNVDAAGLAHVLERLRAADAAVDVEAAGVAGGTLTVVVGRRDGPTAVRIVEDALDAVPA